VRPDRTRVTCQVIQSIRKPKPAASEQRTDRVHRHERHIQARLRDRQTTLHPGTIP